MGGLPLRDARAGLTAIASELRQRRMASSSRAGAAPARSRRLACSAPSIPVLLGWTSREQIVGPHRRIVTDNGLFRPFALVDGRAAGLWRLQGGRVTLEPFAPLDRATTDALAAEAEEVLRYLGLPGRPVTHA